MALGPLASTLWKGCTTRARLVGFVCVGAVGIAVAALLQGTFTADPLERAATFVDWFGLSLVAPVSALVFGTAVLGDPIEDGTYVYLWLRPIGRWQISVAAFAAVGAVVVPVAVVPTVVGVLILGGGELVGATLLATSLAALAYSAVFVFIGQVSQRGLVWGAVYLLIFEQFVARGGKGLGFLSVHSHAVSIVANQADRDLPLSYFSSPTAVIMSTVIPAALVAWSVRRQRTMDVA